MEEVKRWNGFSVMPQEDGYYVAYTDYAALKARVAELEAYKANVDSLHDLVTEAYERTLKERDTLRAQLEAAKFRIAVLEEELNVAADKLVCDRCGKIGLHRCLPALQNICSTPQLTAQPDGVTVRRIIEWAVARARNRPDTNASIIADEGLDRIYGQALAAPAPAPDEVK